MREDDIRTAIMNLSGDKFEHFARELVRRELYPGLNPTSDSHDLGEDARTERTTVFMHNGLWVSLSISKTTRLSKIKSDCRDCQNEGRRIDVMVFVTDEDVQTDTEERWRKEVNAEFQWDLELRTLRWLAPVASQPQHESLVDDYLAVPPPGGDFIQTIRTQFQRQTTTNLRQITNIVPGMNEPLPRREMSVIEEQWSRSQSIVLTGEAGTGKSGIVSMLVHTAQAMGKISLLIDARRLGHVKTEADLRSSLDLKGPVSLAVRRAGAYQGCRVIIDQLDNVVGSLVATVLEDFAIECCQIGNGVQVLVVCRNQVPQESELVERLVKGGFVEIISYEISDDFVIEAFNAIGVSGYSRNLVEMGRNLLNLEIIGSLRQKKPDFDFSTLTSVNETYLWEQYLALLQDRELDSLGHTILAEAIKLAQRGLNSADGVFSVEFPISLQVQRLASWGIISLLEGRAHRFRHEKLQDYIYAWDATERLAMPRDVLSEILSYKSPNVFKWMDVIYQRRNSAVRKKFLREMFDVSG